jgi:glycosyltransferase involved in cell wall biosynthesis
VTGPVYVPDAAGAPLLHRLGPKAGPVVTHLHATSSGLDRLDAVDRQVLESRTDRWIVGSDAMADEALGAGATADRLVRLPDLLTLPGIGELDADFLATVRRELVDHHGIPVDAALAVGIGNVDWWTVPDAFVRIAWEATRRSSDRPLHFLWVADGASDRMLWPLRHDIRHAGLEDRVHIETGARRPWQLIAAGDVLVSSRLGDHEPIGHREAALMGRPVLWFDDPGAPDPLVEPTQGIAVAHLDIDAMADAIVAAAALAADPADAARLTSSADATWLPAIGGPAIVAQLRRPR